jgi:cytoskeleton protein RodZ
MDEARRSESRAGAPNAGAQGSAGALLRAAREHQGMHIATLAAAIKVAPRKLDALENDRWDELPGPTFTRALAQAVCRALKADPQPVMELLPPADTSMLDSTFGTINEPFSGRGRELGLRAFIPRGPWLIAAIVLLLAAALVLWLPAGTWSRLVSRSSAPAGETGGVVTVPVAPQAPGQAGAAGATGGAVPGVPAASPAPTPLSTTPSPTASTTSTIAPTASPTAAASPPGAAVVPAPAAVPAGDLVLQCTARTWIEIIDGRGRILLSRNLEAGESLGLDGVTPLQVVVGNASATQVTYKGKAIDLEPRTRDNVARFDLR